MTAEEPGRLSRERMAELDRQLRELRRARLIALIESRRFIIVSRP